MKVGIRLVMLVAAIFAAPLAWAEECDRINRIKVVCFGIDWESATPADIVDIDVNARDGYDWMPLHWAAKWNTNPEVIEVLLSAGADVNARTKHGATPLHRAGWNTNSKVIEVLLSAGADVNARKKNGATPLHRAAKWNTNPEVIEVLLSAGADVNARKKNGATPLHNAGWNTNPEVLDALLSAGADVSARTKGDGETPLHKAARNSTNSEVIEILLVAGADVNARTKTSDPLGGQTPLHIAVLYESPTAIIVLLEHGADAKLKNSYGITAFDLIEANEALKNTNAYWALHDAQFD